MKRLDGTGLLFYPGIRGLLYLEAFIKNGLLPGIVIIQGTPPGDPYREYSETFWKKHEGYFDREKTLHYYLSEFSIPSVRLSDSDVNSEEMRAAVISRPESTFIFSGGGIIKSPLLDTGKKFIHIHPGLLPEYRGSTCYYYSMLAENICGVSAFYMEKNLDTGEIIAKKTFQVPAIHEEDWMFYDLLFDPWIRGELLAEILRAYVKKGRFDSSPQDLTKGEDYFIIHPLLKNLAIKKQCI